MLEPAIARRLDSDGHPGVAAPSLCLAAALLSALPACSDAGLSPPMPAPRVSYTDRYAQNGSDRVDVLFLIDNSSGMDERRNNLRNNLTRFLQPLADLARSGKYVDLHIGVVTSDYGAGATGAPGCTPSGPAGGGDQGRLIGLGKKAAANCRKPNGDNFIRYAFTAGAPVHNLPDGQDLVETFTCMAAVGDNGCGFEHPLESVYAALHNNILENQGFLRDDARLVVYFLTDEDDASAPPDSDVFDKNKVAEYGYESSYSRQTRFAVMCGDPAAFPPYGDSRGPLIDCLPAPNPDGVSGPGKQFDVSRYRDLFSLPRVQGGVKDSPLDVMLFAIDAPEEPFQVVLSNPGTPTGQPYLRCDTLSESSNPPCIPVLQHSCVNPRNPNANGDPAVRLNSVVRSVRLHQVTSVCDDDLGPALESAARLVVSNLGANCIRNAFPRDETGALITDCQVMDATLEADGSESRVPLPRCDDADRPGITPCWIIEDKPECHGLSPDGLGFSVRRGTTNGVPNPAPPYTSALVDCTLNP